MDKHKSKINFRKWLANKLIQVRSAASLSQKDVALKLEIKYSTYRAYEDGRSEPSLHMIQKICSIYNLKVGCFLEDSPGAKDFQMQ